MEKHEKDVKLMFKVGIIITWLINVLYIPNINAFIVLHTDTGRIPLNHAGFLIGQTVASFSICLALCNPAISLLYT